LEETIKHIPDISSITELETLVSNLIDSVAINDKTNILHYSNSLSNKIKDSKILNTIIQSSEAIGKNLPLSFTLEVNEASIAYINYITNNNQKILPLF
jgi:hypothetical protein